MFLIPLPTYVPFGFNLYGFHRSLVPFLLSSFLIFLKKERPNTWYGASLGGSLCDTSKTQVGGVQLTSHESSMISMAPSITKKSSHDSIALLFGNHLLLKGSSFSSRCGVGNRNNASNGDNCCTQAQGSANRNADWGVF